MTRDELINEFFTILDPKKLYPYKWAIEASEDCADFMLKNYKPENSGDELIRTFQSLTDDQKNELAKLMKEIMLIEFPLTTNSQTKDK